MSASALIAFEGLDQSGKETQARLLRARLESHGRRVETLTFPDDSTPLGQDIRAALAGKRDYARDVMQLLYIANRHERRADITRWLADGAVVICDRYLASSIAYGEAQGLDAAWLTDTQRLLPQPALTILLDIAPTTALARKQSNRDRYERDLDLLARVRDSYRRLAQQPTWALIDGERPREAVADDINAAVATRLALP
jgi:dTMP kinase